MSRRRSGQPSGRRWCARLLVLVLAALPKALALLIIRSPEGVVTSLDTASFVYFPSDGMETGFITDGESIFLTGDVLCHATPSEMTELVRWRVVFSDKRQASCTISEIYDAVAGGDARALVIIGTWSPGLYCYVHSHWDTSHFLDKSTIMVDTSLKAVGKKTLAQWTATGMVGFNVTWLGWPHNKDYQGSFESPQWLILMRLVLPLAALATCVVAVLEIAQLRNALRAGAQLRLRLGAPGGALASEELLFGISALQSKQAVSMLVMVVAVPGMVSVAAFCALGFLGPMTLPPIYFSVGSFFFAFLVAVSTLLVALLVHEETRLASGMARRNVLRRSFCSIVCIFVTFWVFDIFVFAEKTAIDKVVFLFGIAAVVQGVAGLYFYAHSCTLRSTLMNWIRHPATSPQPKNERQLARHLFWIKPLALICPLNTALLGAIVQSLRDNFYGSGVWLCLIFGMTMCQISACYCQIQFLKPHSTPSEVSFSNMANFVPVIVALPSIAQPPARPKKKTTFSDPVVTSIHEASAPIAPASTSAQSVRTVNMRYAFNNVNISTSTSLKPRKMTSMVRQQQQRLVLLQHAKHCLNPSGECPVTPFCAGMKKMWTHLAVCQDMRCDVSLCLSSRVLYHHHDNCTDPDCYICRPVRLLRLQEERFQLMRAGVAEPNQRVATRGRDEQMSESQASTPGQIDPELGLVDEQDGEVEGPTGRSRPKSK